MGIEFARVPRGDLDAIEQDLIRTHVQRGTRLRNRRHVLASAAHETGSDLHVVVTPAEQHAWLNGDTAVADAVERTDDREQRAAKLPQYEALRSHPFGPAAAFFAQLYVQGAIPRPRATEMTFWAASAMPSTIRSTWPRLLGGSVNAMETFVVGWHKHEPDVMWGFLNVRTSTLEEAYGSVLAFVRPRRPWLEVEAADYEAGGGDVTTISVYHGLSLRELLTEPDGQGVMDAAGSLALHLTRKGPRCSGGGTTSRWPTNSSSRFRSRRTSG